jgi:hypothetical protein
LEKKPDMHLKTTLHPAEVTKLIEQAAKNAAQ